MANYVGSITKFDGKKNKPASLTFSTDVGGKNRLLRRPSDKDLSESQGTKLITDKPSPCISPDASAWSLLKQRLLGRLPGNQSCPAVLLSPAPGERRTSFALCLTRPSCSHLLPEAESWENSATDLRSLGKAGVGLGSTPFLAPSPSGRLGQWKLRKGEGKKNPISMKPECKGRWALSLSPGMQQERDAGGAPRRVTVKVVRPFGSPLSLKKVAAGLFPSPRLQPDQPFPLPQVPEP